MFHGGGPFGGGGQHFQRVFDEPEEFDLSDCINMCMIDYHRAGYGGDLEGHCYAECQEQAEEAHMMQGGGFGGIPRPRNHGFQPEILDTKPQTLNPEHPLS